jgi:hypothetical protein
VRGIFAVACSEFVLFSWFIFVTCLNISCIL